MWSDEAAAASSAIKRSPYQLVNIRHGQLAKGGTAPGCRMS